MKTKYEQHAAQAPRSACYYVKPRYTPGTPAMVDLGTALDVAAAEEEAHARNLDGTYGDAASTRAEDKGLDGIVYARWNTKLRVYKLDLITGTLVSAPINSI
jgi:hypothetical protein